MTERVRSGRWRDAPLRVRARNPALVAGSRFLWADTKYAYTYDAAGRRIACAKSGTAFEQSDSINYGYNARSELTSATAAVDSDYRYGYNFDDIGNRNSASERGTNSVYTASQLNQYTTVDDFTPTYDADGNETLVKTATGIWNVTYNGENRPVRWTQGTNTISMSYDRMGRRVTKNNQRFVYNGYLQIADNAGNTYVWDCTENVATRPLVWLASTLNSQPSTFSYTHDGNKNVSEVIASNNDVAAHYEYAPFGAITVSRGTSAADNPWRFSSEYAEDDTATVYYNYRHYEPVTGRWMQRDPIEEKGGLNLLNFVCNSAFEKTDGLGLSFFDYVPFVGLMRAIVDDLIGSIPGESVVDYPFVSPYDCKCNVESAEAMCQAKVKEKGLEYAAGQTISAAVTAAVGVAVTTLTVKFPNWVTAILAAEELVSGAVKAHLLSKVMMGYRMAMANNCKCDQYERK